MSDAMSAPEPPPAPPAAPVVGPRRGLPGWAWGLIVAGTAVVALLVGGGAGFGTGLIAGHLGERVTSVIHPGIGGGMPGGTGHGRAGNGGADGHGFGGRAPGSPATPAPAPNS